MTTSAFDALPPGARLLGDHVIERRLGAGPFGMTYLARDVRLDREVVIQEYLERFQHQAFVESKSPDVSQDFKHLCCTPLQLPKAFVKKSITRLV